MINLNRFNDYWQQNCHSKRNCTLDLKDSKFVEPQNIKNATKRAKCTKDDSIIYL